LHQIIKAKEKPLKGSYSFKIMGVKDGDFGIMSKRLELKCQDRKENARKTKSE